MARTLADGSMTKTARTAWVVEALDREARRIGIGRQAVIKTWIAERLDEEASRRSA